MKEVLQLAMQKKKKYYATIIAMVFAFFVVLLLSTFLSFWLEYLIILLFPLLILPFFIAMQMTMIQLDTMEFSAKKFNRMIMVGMSPMLKKPFRTLKTVLLSFLLFIAFTYLSFLIASYIPYYKDYIAEIINISLNNTGVDMYNAIITYMQTNTEMTQALMFFVSSISYGIAFFFFIFKMLHNALYALCKNSASLPDGHNQPVFKETFKKYAKQYYRQYYLHEWYKVLLVPVLYALGIYVSYLIEKPTYNLFFATIFALIGVVILLPNLMLYQEQTYVLMFEELSTRNFSNMQKIYSDLKGQANLTQEQTDALDDFIKQLEEAIKTKDQDDKKEDKDDESGK